MLHLEKPTAENLKRTVVGLQDIHDHPTPFDIRQSDMLIKYMGQNFGGYLEYWKKCESKEQPVGWVSSSTFLLFDDEQFVGIFEVRHSLTDELKKRGGHIAYQTVPSFRGKGYCQRGLKLILDWAYQNLGIDKALITCHGDNIPSHRVMLKVMADMGGEEKEDLLIDGHIEHGVWINTHI